MRDIITDMRLENPIQIPRPEYQPVEKGQNIEYGLPSVGVEVKKDGVERPENSSEIASKISENILSKTLPDPVVDTISDVSVTTVNDNPLVAGDDDLIEKEWVDRAKKMIEETRDNPYQRDRSKSILQIDYIKKRYGKELGSAE